MDDTVENHSPELFSSADYEDTQLNLNIYWKDQKICQISMAQQSTVHDLMISLKQKLSQTQFSMSKFLCLESINNDEVLDYSLLIGNYKIHNYIYPISLQIVLSEPTKSQSAIYLTDFYFKKCIGKGASATVSLVRHKATGKLYALKQISKQYFVQFKRIQQVLREKKVMAEVLNNSPFISTLYASFESEWDLNFLMEFYPGGEMFFHLHTRRLSEEQAKLYFAQMVVAFQFLHKKSIIYRDLKPENILLDFYGHTRLTDFGLCKISLHNEDLTTSYCGSIQYMAPQIKQNISYSYQVDFYTLGAILYEMVIGVPPYYNSQILSFSKKNSLAFQQLVKGLIQEDVSLRITSFKHIKQSKFMSGIDWNRIINQQIDAPYHVRPHNTYIHDQFIQESVDHLNEYIQEKYEKILSPFNFIKQGADNEKFLKCYKQFYESIKKSPTFGKYNELNKPKEVKGNENIHQKIKLGQKEMTKIQQH